MIYTEQALAFRCEDSRLIGIVALPEAPEPRGVLVVVGGPQYRAGSHRQFTLLCRALAGHGFASMRFDYRGMGDSEGEIRTFENVSADIRAALDELFARVPKMREAIMWGLCDAASAALFYAHRDPRIKGLVLCNPWVRSDASIAKTRLKHYYLARLGDPAFWSRLLRGELQIRESLLSFLGILKAACLGKPNSSGGPVSGVAPLPSLAQRMGEGMRRFQGRVLLILSGNDVTAQEFCEATRTSETWQALLALARVQREDLPAADHTFSRSDWQRSVESLMVAWLKSD
jgi:exosortase A-associated hydrolase 1